MGAELFGAWNEGVAGGCGFGEVDAGRRGTGREVGEFPIGDKPPATFAAEARMLEHF